MGTQVTQAPEPGESGFFPYAPASSPNTLVTTKRPKISIPTKRRTTKVDNVHYWQTLSAAIANEFTKHEKARQAADDVADILGEDHDMTPIDNSKLGKEI